MGEKQSNSLKNKNKYLASGHMPMSDDLLEPGAFCKTLSHLLYVRDHHSASPQIPLHAWHLPLVLQKQSEHLYTPLHVLFILARLNPLPHYLAPPVISLSSACKQAKTSFKTFPWPSYSLRYNSLSSSKAVFSHVAFMVSLPSYSISLFGFC